MRFAIFLPSLRGGGAQRVAVDLANGFVSRGHKVDLVLAKKEGVYFDLLKKEVNLITFDNNRVTQSFFNLITYFRENNPQYFLSIQRNASLISLLAAKYSGWKGFFVARETNSYATLKLQGQSLKESIVSFFIKKAYKMASVVVAPSKGVAKDLSFLNNVKVIYNPVLIPDFEVKSVHKRPFILGAGSLDNQKRFDDLINSFALLINETGNTELDLIIIGEGPERENLMQLAQSLGVDARLHLPGFVTNPFDYMRQTKVFVLSSAWEGLPNVLIQAMACGAPVVATDCPHGPREILANGRFGELVPVGDIAEICKAIHRQLENGRIAYPPDALAPYDINHVISDYEAVLAGHYS